MPGRKRVYDDDNARLRAYRRRKREELQREQQKAIEQHRHDEALKTEARGMAARILRAWISSPEAERFASGSKGSQFEQTEDRLKIVRHIMGEASKLGG